MKLIFGQRGLLLRLIPLRRGRRVRVFRLFELRLRDQVLARLRAVAVELLLRIHEPVLGGVELRGGAGGVLLRVGGIEPRDDLAVLHDITQPHAPLDDLAGDPERQRCRIARLHFARQRCGERLAVGMHGDGDDGPRRRRGGFLVVT